MTSQLPGRTHKFEIIHNWGAPVALPLEVWPETLILPKPSFCVTSIIDEIVTYCSLILHALVHVISDLQCVTVSSIIDITQNDGLGRIRLSGQTSRGNGRPVGRDLLGLWT